LEYPKAEIPLSGAKWAANSEAYAALISEHLSPETIWLDAGCGWRLLEDDMEPLEDWLVDQGRVVIGMDYSVTSHRNITRLVEGSLYALPFADSSLDLVTCNVVVEHLDHPARAFAEVARCLRSGGTLVIKTPNLLNYGVMANAVASRTMPEKLRLRLVRSSDSREPEDVFPVRYKANTMHSLVRLLNSSGLQVHKAIALHQQGPFFGKTEKLERFLMKLTPVSGLLVCAHKRMAA
jgi:SAM-dependent methyltransferase